MRTQFGTDGYKDARRIGNRSSKAPTASAVRSPYDKREVQVQYLIALTEITFPSSAIERGFPFLQGTLIDLGRCERELCRSLFEIGVLTLHCL